MVCYNHEKFIEDAIKGVLLQKTEFEIQLFITNDCSTDNTHSICSYYAERFPELIYYEKFEENIGMLDNWKYNLDLCNRSGSNYIAVCEGDDYWTDPFKLQKQIQFLEENKLYSLCFHNAEIVYEDNSICRAPFNDLKLKDYSGVEIYDDWLVPTASIVFRKSILESSYYDAIKNSSQIFYFDTPLVLTAAAKGYIRGLAECMSVYRKQDLGVTNTFVKDIFKFCQHNLEIPKIFGREYQKSSKRKVANAAVVRSLSLMRKGEFKESLPFLALTFKRTPVLSIKKILKLLIE